MVRIPTWEEFREIVASEHVSWDRKRQFVTGYFARIRDLNDDDLYILGWNSGEQVHELQKNYRDEYELFRAQQEWTDDVNLDEEYAAAKREHDTGVVQAQTDAAEEIRAQCDEAEKQLARLKTQRSQTDPGAANSDEILDTGLSGAVRGLERFYPIYNRAVREVAPTEFGPVDYERDILQRYDEQRDISFSSFLERADEIDTLSQRIGDSLSAQSNRLDAVFSHWNGDSAQRAWSMWQQVCELSRDEVKQGLLESSEAILRSCSAVAASCQRKAAWSLEYAVPNWCGLQPHEIQIAIDIATKGVNAPDGGIKHFLSYLPEESKAVIDEDKGPLAEETKKAAQEWAAEWLQEFTSSFAGYVSNFQAMCDNEKKATDEAWGKLTQFLLELPDDPYAEVATTGAAASAPAVSGGASGHLASRPSAVGSGASVRGAAGMGGNAFGALGGAQGGASGDDGISAKTMPSMPKPNAGPKSAALPTAVNPVTGKSLEVDSEMGNPYPIYPETGEAIKSVAPEVDTVAVSSRESEIPLPDHNGDAEPSIVAKPSLGPDQATVVAVDEGSSQPETDTEADEDAVSGHNGRFAADEPATAPHAAGDATGAAQPASGGVYAEPQRSAVVRPASVAAGDSGVTSVAGAVTEASEPTGGRGSADDADDFDGVGAGVSGSMGGDAQQGIGGSLAAEFSGAGPGTGADGGAARPFGDSAEVAGGASFPDAAGGLALGEGANDGARREASPDGSAGVGSIPAEPTPAPAAQSGSAGVSGVSGASMTGGMGGAGAGAGSGGEDRQRSAGYQSHEAGLFEPDVADGRFGIARISGSLDDDDQRADRVRENDE